MQRLFELGERETGVRQDECAYMKVERSVNGLGSCHNGLGNDLTPKDTYPTAVTNV